MGIRGWPTLDTKIRPRSRLHEDYPRRLLCLHEEYYA